MAAQGSKISDCQCLAFAQKKKKVPGRALVKSLNPTLNDNLHLKY